MRRVKEKDNVFDTIRYHEFYIENLERRIYSLEKKMLRRRERHGKDIRRCKNYICVRAERSTDGGIVVCLIRQDPGGAGRGNRNEQERQME